VIRILVGLALGYVALVTWPSPSVVVARTGTASLVYLIVGLEVLATGILGWSPVYALFGISTNAKVHA